MLWHGLRCIFVLFVIVAPARATPFLPAADDSVLERLPIAPSDPVLGALRAQGAQLRQAPENLPLALRVARGYVELGRSTGDPRYVGYAQAALAPWWGQAHPPADVLLLRAALRQRVHQFDPALEDLDAVIDADPRNAQARLMRATILQVTGAFDSARAECRAFSGFSAELVRRACFASVDSVTGRLRAAYRDLRDAPGAASPAMRSWITTMLAEMAARAGLASEAETHYRDALKTDGDDFYLLSAYADFLLDHGRAAEVEALLKDRDRVDPLLLRLALAAKATKSDALAQRVAQLRDRFDASRRRGDAVHLREEARFTLELLNDPGAALKLAQENWRVQKEPADIRILIESAIAAQDDAALAAARGWLKATALEDSALEKILSASAHPD